MIIQSPVKSTRYPTADKEIDLMKYADEDTYPPDYYKRIILSEKDLLGLIWLTKLKLNEEGTYKVTSYNQAPSEQEKQRIKWMLILVNLRKLSQTYYL